MTSSLAVPRLGSTAGLKGMPNLPVIQHPMSRLGNAGDLTVRGSGRIRRDKSSVSLGTDSNPLRKSAPDRILQWPPAIDYSPPFHYRRYLGQEAGIIQAKSMSKKIPKKIKKISLPAITIDGSVTNQKASQRSKFQLPTLQENAVVEDSQFEEFELGPYKSRQKRSEAGSRPGQPPEELRERVKEKFSTGTHALRHLFKSNDPTGKGNVSREALLRILYSVVGYVTPDQFNKLLKSNGLEFKDSISFDTFVSSLQDKDSKNGWVNTFERTGEDLQRNVPEPHLRRTDITKYDPFISAPFAETIFKENIKTIHDARKVFPEACFIPNGRVVPPQLREAYAQLGIYLKDVDFTTLWQRYDKEGLGAIRTNLFCKRLAIDITGRPRTFSHRTKTATEMAERPKSDLAYATVTDLTELKNTQAAVNERLANASRKGADNKTDTSKKETEQKGTEDATQVKGSQEQSQKNSQTNNDKEAEAKMKSVRKKRLYPKLENVIDSLHYRFEESYNALLAAFDLFDYLSDGYISRVDFRRVLQEFGLNISATEMDNFLSKNGIRTIRGQINYREFLNKFQSKSENSITNKIISNPNHKPLDQPTIAWPLMEKTLTTEELEASVVDLLHGEFMKLINNFKACDKYNLGVITKHEFRTAIEKCLGYPISQRQWEQLLSDIGTDVDGLVPYTNFLQMFEVPPGSWNVRQDRGYNSYKVQPSEMPLPAAVDRLKEKAKTYMQPHEIRKPRVDNGVRTMDDVHTQLEELFRTKFHTFDKHFRDMDRKMIGRMSKWQFGALLKLCGLSLTPSELDRLWVTLDISDDGMYSYSTLIQHFAHARKGKDQKNDMEVVREVQKERKEVRSRTTEVQRSKTEVKEIVTEEVSVKETNTQTVTAPQADVPKLMIPPGTSLSVKSVRTRDLLNKIKSQVIGNWEGLKSVFKYIDRNGYATISISEMKEVMKSMNFALTEEETKELCQRFDLRRDGRFHYLEFMKCYSKQSSTARAQPPVYSKDYKKLEKKMKAEYKNLRRAFWKFDHSRNGYVTIDEFKRVLNSCRIEPSSEEFYFLLNEFDREMNGRISYNELLNTLIDN